MPGFLEDTVSSMVAFAPRLVGAVLILRIGWVIGMVVVKAVSRLTDTIELDRAVLDTPPGRVLGGTERAVSKAVGTIATWFVFGLALLAAADVLAIEVLSEWIATAVEYLPAFIAGPLVIVVGFRVADFVGDAISRTRADGGTDRARD